MRYPKCLDRQTLMSLCGGRQGCGSSLHAHRKRSVHDWAVVETVFETLLSSAGNKQARLWGAMHRPWSDLRRCTVTAELWLLLY